MRWGVAIVLITLSSVLLPTRITLRQRSHCNLEQQREKPGVCAKTM
jgi:hypothetical protein